MRFLSVILLLGLGMFAAAIYFYNPGPVRLVIPRMPGAAQGVLVTIQPLWKVVLYSLLGGALVGYLLAFSQYFVPHKPKPAPAPPPPEVKRDAEVDYTLTLKPKSKSGG